MKRFLSILLALALALTLGIPALAAEHQAGDTYIRILGSSGARTVGVRTTYGAYRQTADGAVYRDDRYEFVYTDDGVSWVSAGAAELKQRLAAAQPELLRVTVDGKPVTFPISLYQVSGCTMAPLRQMAQALGYTFDYDGSSRTAVCARGTDTISVRAASTQATVNGKTTNWLAVPAELRGGIFCVPVRFFAEAAGADVTWDAAGQTFYLTTAIQEG